MAYTLPTFFAEWVERGIGEWLDTIGEPCIPKIRVAEVEVAVVCASYGLPVEVSSYINRLAFSKHLPTPLLTRLDMDCYGAHRFVHKEFEWYYTDSEEVLINEGAGIYIGDPERCYSNNIEEYIEEPIDKGRSNSIRVAKKLLLSEEGLEYIMERYGDTGWGRIAISNNYDAQLCSLPAGKHRNEMRNYINSVEQTYDCRIYSVEDEEVQDYLRSRELCGNAIRPYKKLTKKSFTR